MSFKKFGYTVGCLALAFAIFQPFWFGWTNFWDFFFSLVLGLVFISAAYGAKSQV